MFIYQLIQKILYLFVYLLSRISKNKKLSLFVQLRNEKQFKQDIDAFAESYALLKTQNAPLPEIYWFHVSSAGEMEQAIPVARRLHEALGVVFLLTYYSPSALPFVKNFPALLGATGLPLDIPQNYSYLFAKLPIKKLFFVRYDFWPCLIQESRKNWVELNLIAATVNSTHSGVLGFLSRQFKRGVYRSFDNIFAVTKEDEAFFKQHYPHCFVTLAGDAKWARAAERAAALKTKEKSFEVARLSQIVNFYKTTQQKKCIVFGSPHEEEHIIALECLNLNAEYFIVYVPHHVDEKHCQKIVDDFTKEAGKVFLFSQILAQNFASEEALRNFLEERAYDGIVIDKMGMLAEIYSVADVAVVGGGFDSQVHNTLEPASHGVPVFLGNRLERAQEARTLVQAGAALTFQKSRELFQFLSACDSLAEVRSKALSVFRQIPNTSEVILQSLAHNKRQDTRKADLC